MSQIATPVGQADHRGDELDAPHDAMVSHSDELADILLARVYSYTHRGYIGT